MKARNEWFSSRREKETYEKLMLVRRFYQQALNLGQEARRFMEPHYPTAKSNN